MLLRIEANQCTVASTLFLRYSTSSKSDDKVLRNTVGRFCCVALVYITVPSYSIAEAVSSTYVFGYPVNKVLRFSRWTVPTFTQCTLITWIRSQLFPCGFVTGFISYQMYVTRPVDAYLFGVPCS